MSECTCHKNYTLDTLIPKVGVITDIRQETPDVKTFRVNAPEGGKLFEHARVSLNPSGLNETERKTACGIRPPNAI